MQPFLRFYGPNHALKSFKSDLKYGDSANVYVAPQKIAPNNSKYLPWGANPESTEVVNNFFPNFGSYYLDPYYFNMGFNPYFGYGGYGFGPSFYHNLLGYEMGYPFYRHYSFYFSQYFC